MPKPNDEFGLPEYLVFLILGHIRELRKTSPDHILVKAVESALAEDLAEDRHGPPPEQLSLF